MITITESAQLKIKEILEAETPESHIRMFVQGGGCAGFSYGFTIDTEHNEDDFEIPTSHKPVLVDSASFQYLQDATVDYVENLEGSRFSITNPQAQTTCGCGASFNPF